MKFLGVLFAIGGWLLVIASLSWTSSNGARLIFCLIGITLSAVGILKFLNGAYLKQAIWKR